MFLSCHIFRWSPGDFSRDGGYATMMRSDMKFFQPYKKTAIVGLGEGERSGLFVYSKKGKEGQNHSSKAESKKQPTKPSKTFLLIA